MSRKQSALFTEKRAIASVDMLMAGFWGIVIIAVLITSVPEHAIGSTSLTKDMMKSFLPEGWAFFTRNPREATEKFYEEQADGSVVPGNASDLRSIGSPSRLERIRSMEVGMVLPQVPKEAWVPCENTFAECLKVLPPDRAKISISMHDCSYRGRAVIQRNAPIPWAWRTSYHRIRMPSMLARVEVECVQLQGAP
jgi:antimicrobial peptide system SdpA family protein